MPLRPGEPVGEAIHELTHFGSRPRSHEQIVAIAEANHRRRASGGGIMHRVMGGGIAGASAPDFQTPITQLQQESVSPYVQSQLSQYGQLSNEKLQEMAMRYGSSPQGQLVQRLLQTRRLGQAKDPTANTQATAPSAPTAPTVQPTQAMQMSGPTPVMTGTQRGLPTGLPYRKGGGLPRAHFASGGEPLGLSPGMASPWWERSEERNMDSGFLHGATDGRADRLMATAPSGAYILPADVVAGLGSGNSLAGARVWEEILRSGPWGISSSAPRSRGPAEARAPMPREEGSGRGIDIGADDTEAAAKGGGVQGKGITGRIPVALSHGEIIVHPDDVRRIGNGNIKLGHARLDRFVIRARAEQIKQLKKLKPPVGANDHGSARGIAA